jgi:hypothetical protein
MVTIAGHIGSRGPRWHLRTWLQATALVYVAAFVVLLLGAGVALMVRGLIELVSWTAGLLR